MCYLYALRLPPLMLLQSLSWLGSKSSPHKGRQSFEHTFLLLCPYNVSFLHCPSRPLWSNSHLIFSCFHHNYLIMFATLHQSWIIYWFSTGPRSIHLHAFNHALFPFRLKVLPTLHYSLVVPPAPPDHLHKKELFLNAHLESHAYHEISRDCTTAGIITQSEVS